MEPGSCACDWAAADPKQWPTVLWVVLSTRRSPLAVLLLHLRAAHPETTKRPWRRQPRGIGTEMTRLHYPGGRERKPQNTPTELDPSTEATGLMEKPMPEASRWWSTQSPWSSAAAQATALLRISKPRRAAALMILSMRPFP